VLENPRKRKGNQRQALHFSILLLGLRSGERESVSTEEKRGGGSSLQTSHYYHRNNEGEAEKGTHNGDGGKGGKRAVAFALLVAEREGMERDN